MKGINYVNRIRDLPITNWSFQVYYNLLREGVDTKWMKEIRKINGGLIESGNIQELERNSIKEWKEGVNGKVSLGLYPAGWKGKRKPEGVS